MADALRPKNALKTGKGWEMRAIEVTKFEPCRDLNAPNQLFADGGVIGNNPSKIGGTYACSLLKDGRVLWQHSGVIVPSGSLTEITNNLSELIAVLEGLYVLPNDWVGIIYSDSKITLGRVFCDWGMTGVPDKERFELVSAKKRLYNWSKIRYCLVDGHPTKKQLQIGVGKRGGPVHEQNVWCDKECGRLAKIVQKEISKRDQLRVMDTTSVFEVA